MTVPGERVFREEAPLVSSCYNDLVMYYGTGDHGPEREPRWWEETWVLTRAVFGALFLPLFSLFVTLIAILVVILLFTTSPLLGVVAFAVMLGGIWLFARWQQSRR